MSESDEPSPEIAPLRPPRVCPTCSKPSVKAVSPFCSKRCADVDLHRWLSGAYAIPSVEGEADEDSAI